MQQPGTRHRPSPRLAGMRARRLRVGQCRRTYHPSVRQASPATIPKELLRMDLPTLIQHCHAENERFAQGQADSSCFAYELFRRALVERSEVAWAQIYQDYCGIVEHWVRRCPTQASSEESTEFLVVEAFTRFWRAIQPERFGQFPTLSALLRYLQRCATSAVLDSARCASAWLPEADIPVTYHTQHSPDEEVFARIERAEFWNYVNSLLHDANERVICFEAFVLGLKPRQIYARHPDSFRTVEDVYIVKRAMLGRLGQDARLRGMCGEKEDIR